jgi:hypothetical protein
MQQTIKSHRLRNIAIEDTQRETGTKKKPFSNYVYVGFEVLTAVAMKSSVFWDIMQCSSETSRRLEGEYRLKMEAIYCSETSDSQLHGVTTQKTVLFKKVFTEWFMNIIKILNYFITFIRT